MPSCHLPMAACPPGISHSPVSLDASDQGLCNVYDRVKTACSVVPGPIAEAGVGSSITRWPIAIPGLASSCVWDRVNDRRRGARTVPRGGNGGAGTGDAMLRGLLPAGSGVLSARDHSGSGPEPLGAPAGPAACAPSSTPNTVSETILRAASRARSCSRSSPGPGVARVALDSGREGGSDRHVPGVVDFGQCRGLSTVPTSVDGVPAKRDGVTPLPARPGHRAAAPMLCSSAEPARLTPPCPGSGQSRSSRSAAMVIPRTNTAAASAAAVAATVCSAGPSNDLESWCAIVEPGLCYPPRAAFN
mmetsp:Transcript_78776/g.222728  ORF Transcript_78776/g.222728 Transcript_78776/m.222728 type:complete len:303 (+) Transcript_78776:1293-2201(+)